MGILTFLGIGATIIPFLLINDNLFSDAIIRIILCLSPLTPSQDGPSMCIGHDDSIKRRLRTPDHVCNHLTGIVVT